MSSKYFYQHEDTGYVCCTESNVPPSHRWFSITESDYRKHEIRPSGLLSNASKSQPSPVRGRDIVVDFVLSDIRERAEMGKQKYGTYLETRNGRDALWDAYQEAIDLVMYLRQELLERRETEA